MKYRNEISAYVDSHREEMLRDICTLCSINSERMPAEEGKPYGQGAARALEAALSMAEGYGFSVRSYDNYVGTADLNEGERQLDILAHLDVVPAGEGWKETEPFVPVLRDGRIYGRGTSDDKGPLVAALYAMRCVKEMKLPVSRNVRLIMGCDEECGSSDIAYYYAREKEAPMTFSPDASFPVTNTEKGRLAGEFSAEFSASYALPRLVSLDAGLKVNVVPGKASAVVEGIGPAAMQEAADRAQAATGVAYEMKYEGDTAAVTAQGRGAHAAEPEGGNNALTGLLYLLNSLPLAPCPQTSALAGLLEMFPHGDVHGTAFGIDMEDEASGRLTLAFSMLKVREDGLEGCFDVRCPLCATDGNLLDPARERMAQAGIVLHNDSFRPPHHVDGDSHFVRMLLSAYEEYTGREGSCQSMGGGTYVHDLENGVAFGASMPETDNRMHGADEFAVFDELLVSAKIFAQVIVELCS